MTANRPPTADELNGVKQDTVQWPAKAYRVTQTDSDGLEIDSTNPLPVSLSSDIEIGAVEIKDATTDERVNVTWDGFYSAMAVTDGRMVFNVDDNGIADSQIPQTTLDLN